MIHKILHQSRLKTTANHVTRFGKKCASKRQISSLKIRSRSLASTPVPISVNSVEQIVFPSSTLETPPKIVELENIEKILEKPIENLPEKPKDSPETPYNPTNIQLLPPTLRNQVFPGDPKHPHPEQVSLSLSHLHKHQLAMTKPPPLPPVQLQLPALQGDNIEQHFQWISALSAEPWLSKAKKLVNVTLPPMPKHWSTKVGWTRYNKQGKGHAVDHPDEDALILDVETMPADGPWPIMATAVSSQAWYSWTSPRINEAKSQPDDSLLLQADRMIHLGHREMDRIIVGHNVGFDRARLWEEYHMQGTKTRFLDTMSFHVAVSGLSSQQRGAWLSQHKEKERRENLGLDPVDDAPAWMKISSMNSLEYVSELYLGKKLDKSPRNILLGQDWQEIHDNFQELMTYCAKDVLSTFEVYQAVFPKYLSKCPHPASFAGVLQMGSAYLTTSDSWFKYLEHAEQAYATRMEKIEERLLKLAEKAIEEHLETESWRDDAWLQHLDWSVPVSSRPPRTQKSKLLSGMPTWYRDLWDSKVGRIKLTTNKRVAPYLLRLQWRGYTLYYSKPLSCWTFRVPKTDTGFSSKSPPIPIVTDPTAKTYDPIISTSTTHVYYRLPHKDGDDSNVGNPLSKSYITAFEEGILTSEYPEAKEILKWNAECTYWLGSRQRIVEQFVIRGEDALGLSQDTHVIIPQVITMGTVTRRAVEKTWMTASNAKPTRIGSELKSVVSSPSGYKFVGADVDSQELWISSLLGDAGFQMHGSTALGWMTLQGTKSDGTDLHSRSASILGIGRDNAKIFNYGRIYGAGVKYATSLLQQFNAEMTEEEARVKAQELFTKTKGIQARTNSQSPFGKYYHGGTESYMFNRLERIASSTCPTTPALGAEIPDALTPSNVKSEYMTSRINWVVQSSGVDYLHLLLVSMNYLIKRFDIKARLLITIHDEVRYLVKEEDENRAALALQISNLWTRAMFCHRLGLTDLPLSCAFFSAVDLDTCLRKEVDMTCVTPSNPNPVPPGKHVDIYETLTMTNGILGQGESKDAREELQSVLKREGVEMDQYFSSEKIQQEEDVEQAPTIPANPTHWSMSLISTLGQRIPAQPIIPGIQFTLHDLYWLKLQDATTKDQVDKVVKEYKGKVVEATKGFVEKSKKLTVKR